MQYVAFLFMVLQLIGGVDKGGRAVRYLCSDVWPKRETGIGSY